MDRFDSMSSFVAVVENKGFSAASRKLGIPLATVSRRVSELEDHLNTRLLNRSTRQVTLTENGRQYFETCRRILEDISQAERLAAGEYETPRGELVITAPIRFGELYVTPIITDFLKDYPEVDIKLLLLDRNVNMLEERVDVAVRIGELPDSTLFVKRIGNIRLIVCASPAYLSNRGRPEHPRDLINHDCVTFLGLSTPGEWPFTIDKKSRIFPVRSRLVTSTAESAVEATLSGSGITRLLCYQASHKIVSGELDLLLTDYEPEPYPINFVYPSGRLMPAKLRAFLDFAGVRLKASLLELS